MEISWCLLRWLAELDAIDGITEIINDSGVFHVNKHLVKEIENMRLDIEELHGFIKAALVKTTHKHLLKEILETEA